MKVVKLIEGFQYQICEGFLTLNYNQATLYTDRRNEASLMAWAQSKLKKLTLVNYSYDVQTESCLSSLYVTS